MASSEQTGAMTNALYEKIKNSALLVLPALATLYYGIAEIWHLSHGPEVVATITVVDTFLGVILKLSTKAYYKNGSNFDGALSVVDTNEEGPLVNLSINQDRLSDAIDDPGKHSVEFKLNKVPDSTTT